MERRGRWLAPVLLVLFFVIINGCMYALFTRRLSNNFGSAASVKMVDVGSYLPHEEGSKLVRIDASLTYSADDAAELPKMDGAAALVPVYAAFIDNLYPKGTVKYEGGTFSDDNYYGENFAADSAMQYNNTVRGFTALVDGKTDLFFSVKPSAEQMKYAQEKGVELVCVPIGREAFVFFVNADNPVDGLTMQQIRDIYAGKITNWKDVGGANRPINAVTRYPGSGSQTTMDAIMKDTPYGRKSVLAVFGASLGYSFRYYLSDMVADSGVKMLSVNGVYPDAGRIRDGSYPIIAEFYAIYRSDNTNPHIPEIVDWILSDEGQEIVGKTGYVSVR